MSRQKCGILVFEETGSPLLAAGLCEDKSLADELAKLWRERADIKLKQVFPITNREQPLLVSTFDAGSAVCFLVFESDADEALAEFISTVDFSDDILRHFVTNPYEAITVVDAAGKLLYMSPVHEKFFGLRHGEATGQPVTEVIENTRLQEVAVRGRAQIGQVQEMNGVVRIVSRTPIFDRNKRRVGAIGQVMFKGPEALEELRSELTRVRQELDFYKRELSGMRNRTYGLDQIVGTSDAVRRLKEDIVRIAPLDVPVLIAGESGTGKELVAHALHMLSPRSDSPMVLVNAAAMPSSLVEAELFGYEGGAFTGADRKGRKGKFEQADGGTLFLDEIGDMPLDTQVKLLRTLQDGNFERVGGDRRLHSDFRLISASNRDFDAMISENTFRLDLFYRIAAVTLRLPPLRERLEDIPMLADTFLTNFSERHGVPKKSVTAEVVQYLQSQHWPGNIRQLQHAIERAAIFADGPSITLANCGYAVSSTQSASGGGYAPLHAQREKATRDVRVAKERAESELIVEAMQRLKGNKKRVAEELGVSRSYLYKRLNELSIE
ncbi:sigma-54 interaction domain-containing protein [Paraburkholderia fungorum]|uniref:sigma-54 interaction domain-containing protein n=1 Tax=Paraburkholderia fungorum TaxID=134537 RepID=UPI002096F05F|nr:sigma 54-interacting transcriptional regulator [Paraburkholderia fungorum]USX06767.1 sigma 54-interacting transcriptional regulator [Paraburkholderia fungorum]